MSFEPGHVVADKYRIVRMIGRGGVGEVYEGENLRIRRRVAIKTLKAEFVTKADIVQRFEREAQAAGRIGSAHIVEVLDLGDLPDGSRFLVMEFLEGETLSRRIRTVGRMSPFDAAQLVCQLLEGLGGAHAAGIVHRDLKPANIYLVPRNGESFVKILDFGVSKFNTLASDELSMTKTGAVMGTPYYMAPEQAKGSRTVDGRADLYAVGVIAYECVTGQVPFSAQTFNELLFKIVLEAPPPIEQFVPDVDPGFAALVRKAMHREPAMRFQTAGEFLYALAGWLQHATGGRLGRDLAQTSAFSGPDGGASTMILDADPGGGAPMGPPGSPMGPPGPRMGPPGPRMGAQPGSGLGPPPLPHPDAGAAAGWPAQQGMAPPGTGHGAGAAPTPDWAIAGHPQATTAAPKRSPVPLALGAVVGLSVLLAAGFAFVRWGGAAAEDPSGSATAASAAPAVTSAPAVPGGERDSPAPTQPDEPAPDVPPAESSPPATGQPATGQPATTPDRPPAPTRTAPTQTAPPPPTGRPPPPPPGKPPATGRPSAGRPISGDL